MRKIRVKKEEKWSPNAPDRPDVQQHGNYSDDDDQIVFAGLDEISPCEDTPEQKAKESLKTIVKIKCDSYTEEDRELEKDLERHQVEDEFYEHQWAIN